VYFTRKEPMMPSPPKQKPCQVTNYFLLQIINVVGGHVHALLNSMMRISKFVRPQLQ